MKFRRKRKPKQVTMDLECTFELNPWGFKHTVYYRDLVCEQGGTLKINQPIEVPNFHSHQVIKNEGFEPRRRRWRR